MSVGPIVITGATGLIGRHCVATARAQKATVRALVRTREKIPPQWAEDPDIETVVIDLTTGDDMLVDALRGASAVIHCAAAMTGDHARDTEAASSALIDALVAADVPHVVLVGSLSVYDVRSLPDGDTLTEECPLCTHGRDAYAQAKHAQELLFKDGASLYGFSLSVLRLGAVWGPGHLFNAHIGPSVGALGIIIDGGGDVPLCQVGLAADMLVRAARSPSEVGTLNILDDDLPNRRRFMVAFRACGWPKLALRTPLFLWRIASMLTPNSKRLPGLLKRAVLEARHRPLRYSNALMHKRLGPVTITPFEGAMQTAIHRQIKQADPS
ncbi:NAD-dependent epimerase/dehydratase family protein [Shimia sp.]|uniref:NAD-dependent epimerase/dehydratase family protein n=1 Tax=Shimia sp. TaxID=1954381 RepID=UPI003B8AA101